MSELKMIGTSASTTLNIDVDKLGAPGVRGTLRIVPTWEDQSRNTEGRLTDVNERSFSISMLLSKSPIATEAIQGDFTAEHGSSFCKIEPGRDFLLVEAPDGALRLDINKLGELSLVSMDVVAHNADEARSLFLRAIGPTLDNFSYIGNFPIHTGMMRILDIRHDIQHLDVTSPYRPFLIKSSLNNLERHMLPIYSMYREAKNSNSVYYQLLCYHKIIEGIQKMKNDVLRSARRYNIPLTPPVDLFPAHDDISPAFHMYVGKSIKSFYDKLLTRKFRDSVAHFILKENTVLHPSSPEALLSFAQVVFASEQCVRVLIENHEYVCKQFKERMPNPDQNRL